MSFDKTLIQAERLQISSKSLVCLDECLILNAPSGPDTLVGALLDTTTNRSLRIQDPKSSSTHGCQDGIPHGRLRAGRPGLPTITCRPSIRAMQRSKITHGCLSNSPAYQASTAHVD